METTAATARIPDSTAGGTGLTTSSRRDRLLLWSLLAQDRARTRRQAENAYKSSCVLLIVALAHGERRQIGAIERVLRFAARDRDIAFVEAQSNGAADIVLRARHKRIKGLAQRREPQAEVNQLGVLERDMLLEVHKIAIEAERFEFSMCREQQRAPRS